MRDGTQSLSTIAMTQILFRRYSLPFLLLLLLALNGIHYWPRRHALGVLPRQSRANAPDVPAGPNDGAQFDAVMRQRMEAALQKLPPEQRQVADERMQADRSFFESLRGLPEDQRREKLEKYFAENPPPSGVAPESLPPGGPGLDGGPPGDGGPMHLPAPAIRRSMDQQIANARKPN
jgi:hypothetical protein